MNIKIIGVGKCGSRMCYDFFAYIRGFPLAYDIRTRTRVSPLSRILEEMKKHSGIQAAAIKWRTYWEQLTGTELLKDSAYYAIVDSDLANNEITQFVLKDREGEETIFPGRSYHLGSHTGGCDFQ